MHFVLWYDVECSLDENVFHLPPPPPAASPLVELFKEAYEVCPCWKKYVSEASFEDSKAITYS